MGCASWPGFGSNVNKQFTKEDAYVANKDRKEMFVAVDTSKKQEKLQGEATSYQLMKNR